MEETSLDRLAQTETLHLGAPGNSRPILMCSETDVPVSSSAERRSQCPVQGAVLFTQDQALLFQTPSDIPGHFCILG